MPYRGKSGAINPVEAMLTMFIAWGLRECVIRPSTSILTSLVRFVDALLLATYVLNASQAILGEFLYTVAMPVGFAGIILYTAAV